MMRFKLLIFLLFLLFSLLFYSYYWYLPEPVKVTPLTFSELEELTFLLFDEVKLKSDLLVYLEEDRKSYLQFVCQEFCRIGYEPYYGRYVFSMDFANLFGVNKSWQEYILDCQDLEKRHFRDRKMSKTLSFIKVLAMKDLCDDPKYNPLWAYYNL